MRAKVLLDNSHYLPILKSASKLTLEYVKSMERAEEERG